MQITRTLPSYGYARPMPAAPSAPEPKLDSYENGKLLKIAGYTAVGAGMGIYAGLANGFLAGAAGAGAGLMGGTAVGVLAGAFLAEKVLKLRDESAIAGTVIAGGIIGLAAGVAGGIYVGTALNGPVAAAGMGILGAVGGFWQGVLNS